MATIIKLDEYLKRQKELFNAYITSSGQEVSVMPFASSYNQQDNKTYTGDDLLRYIDSYTKGNLITNEELDKYNNTKKMPNDLIFKRGRIIIEAIIASHGDTKNLDRLGRDFAKKDGRLHPYDNKYLLKCRDYYLKNNKKVSYVESKYEALKGADALLLITEWKEFRQPDFDEIVKLLKQPVIFDGRNQYDSRRLKKKGIEYYQIGVR